MHLWQRGFFLFYAALICFATITLFCPQFFLGDEQRKAKSAYTFFWYQMANWWKLTNSQIKKRIMVKAWILKKKNFAIFQVREAGEQISSRNF